MRANWFIGLPVPGGGWFEALPPCPPGCRMFGRDDVHLTVAFLGGVTEAAARAAWVATSWRDAPRTVTLGDVVPMGSPRRYSALSLLLVGGRTEVEAEIGRARGPACAAAGVTLDARPPKAHVTIARPTRKASAAERQAALAWARSIDVRGRAVVLDAIALYTWSDDRTQALFRVVERTALPRAR